MRKLLISFLILIIFTLNSNSHIGHYKKYKKIEMDILRNGEVVGYNYYFFSRKKNETIVTNQIKFTVKLLGKSVFEIEGYGEEKYFKNQLVSYVSKTMQNNKQKFVNLILDDDREIFIIEGSSYKGNSSIDSVIGNWWNHKILQSERQISPISGSIKEQVVFFIGKKKINQYGKIYDVDHFKLQSKDMTLPKNKRLDFEIWYDPINSLIIRVSYSRMGNWEYRLRNFE